MEKKSPRDSEIWQRPEGIIFANLTKFTTLQRKVFLGLGIINQISILSPFYQKIHEELIIALPLTRLNIPNQQRLL